MPLNIVIDTTLVKTLIEACSMRLREIESQESSLAKERAEIVKLLNTISGQDPVAAQKVKETEVPQSTLGQLMVQREPERRLSAYNPKWTWWSKAYFALKQNKRPMSTSDIIEYLSGVDPSVKEQRTLAVANVSALLGRNAKYETSPLTRTKGLTGEWEYEIKERVLQDEALLDLV